MSMQQKPEGAAAVLVVGIVSLVVCAPLGIVAWIMGNSYVGKCRALGVEPEGIGVVGKILGIVATALMAIGILGFIAMMALGVGAAAVGGG